MHEEFRYDQALAKVAERSRELLPKPPGVLDCHVALSADEWTAADWHVALMLGFESANDTPPHAAQPDHRACVGDYLRRMFASIAAHKFGV